MHILIISLKFIVFSIFIIIFSACTTGNEVKPLSASTQQYDPDAEVSAKLNEESLRLHKELKRRGLIFNDEEANRYINNIGQNLAPDFMKNNESLHFFIIKNATANAMALPNGNIYANIGLLSAVENEDQLAAILAHEIIHVVQRHALKSKLNREDAITAANIVDIFLLGSGISYISAAGSLASFSREQEKEADLNSLRLLQQGGYDVRQSPAVFRRFQSLPESLTIKNSIFSSHPDNVERVRYLEKVVQDSYSGSVEKAKISDVFNNVRAKVIESNVQIRLNNHQYKLALYTLGQAENYYQNTPLIKYYRGEVYRLMAENPKKAADESKSLSGKGEKYQDESYFEQNMQAHYKKAESFYLEALTMQPDLALSYKGLGLIDYSNLRYEKAIENFDTYLKLSDKPTDSLYIKRLIRNSKRKLGVDS